MTMIFCTPGFPNAPKIMPKIGHIISITSIYLK